jgi:hypothetical protein
MVFDRLVGWDRVAQLLPPDVMTMLDGRYVNTTGNETMSGTLTLTSTTSPQLILTPSSGNSQIDVRAVAGQNALIAFMTGTANRWQIAKNSSAESGGNAGSDFQISRFDDAGAFVDNPLAISRATGIASFAASPTAPTPANDDNTTKLATTAWVNTNAVENFTGQDLTLWKGTQAQYNALGVYDSNTVYCVTP